MTVLDEAADAADAEPELLHEVGDGEPLCGLDLLVHTDKRATSGGSSHDRANVTVMLTVVTRVTLVDSLLRL
jgi:hypothetical protein